MRVLQTIAFLALVVSAGGIENQNGELQPAAIGIMIVALVVMLFTARHENAPACGNRNGANRNNLKCIIAHEGGCINAN